MFTFFQASYGRHLGFQNGDCFFLKSSYISASKHHRHIVQFAMYQDIFSFRIFGDLENYTFLETLGPSESEKQCLHFSKHPMAAILDFKMATVFF